MARRVNIAQFQYLRALVYGLPGNYKTRTVATAALDDRTWPTLMLECRGNPISIRDYDRHPDIVRVAELEDLNDPYDWIKRGQPKDDPLAKKFELGQDGPYKCIIVDQITEAQRMFFDRVMGTARLGPGSIPGKREWDHYNKVLYGMIQFSKLYYDLPIHVIMVAQEREGDVDSGRPIGPLLEGQGQTEVSSYAELIIRMIARGSLEPKLKRVVPEDTQSMAFFSPGEGNFYAKDQVSGGRLGKYMINPTMTKILDLVYGEAAGGTVEPTEPKPNRNVPKPYKE